MFIALTLQSHSIMEAFILQERVLTAQHMARLDHKDLKYIKKYDLPDHKAAHPHIYKNQNVHTRQKISRSPHFNFTKIKNLLSSLTGNIKRKSCQNNSMPQQKIDKYFSSLSDSSKALKDTKINKSGLLIKRFSPHSQQYDSNLNAVSRRPPCWTFSPHDRQLGEAFKSSNFFEGDGGIRTKTAEKHAKREWNTGGNRVSQRQSYAFQKAERKIYEQMRQRSGFGQNQHQCKLQYSPQDLGRCTVQIFKKYHLDNNAYFKKFVADIQQM